ncbi:hypothetical protein ACUN24_09455 [Pedobacter sp. WC2501]|uniref:hypothetical protein n=1 Tax=Pedobacter sp. WC2501 TaxID=3461400 RepID=UPI0040463D42
MDSEENFFEVQKQRQLEKEKEELSKNAEKIEVFIVEAGKKGVQLTTDNFKLFRTIGIVVCCPNIVGLIYPNLEKDKEGLLDFNTLLASFERRRFANGNLYGKSSVLLASRYFRRAYTLHNNFAPRFVEFFWNIKEPNIESYISIDFDALSLNTEGLGYMELDTWYGAKFNKDIGKMSDGNTKLRPPLDLAPHHISFFFADIYSLDIKWSSKEGIKSFQAEEFKTEETKVEIDGVEYYPVRYVHAEYVLDKGYFRHFDGAIHFYTTDEYYRRRDDDFNFNAKNSSHIKTYSEKLFKLNGVVSVDLWIEFTSHFLWGNPLVFEYFEGSYPPHILEMLEKVKNLKDRGIED